MCRFIIYKGRETLMSDMLLKSKQSLINQSFDAKEREEPLNGDGFGIGWYDDEYDQNPCVFTSIQPAWSNRNLHRLSDKIRTSCFLAHVRAATADSLVNELNCHPFQYGQFLWMHNGYIPAFATIKRRLRAGLSDPYYNMIQGTTDSETAFALFLENLGDAINDYSVKDLRKALIKTIQQITYLQREAGIEETSYLNFVVCDGKRILASRFASDHEVEPQTLYYSIGDRFELTDGIYRMINSMHSNKSIVIASEPLTAHRQDWQSVERNHIVQISAKKKITHSPIEI